MSRVKAGSAELCLTLGNLAPTLVAMGGSLGGFGDAPEGLPGPLIPCLVSLFGEEVWKCSLGPGNLPVSLPGGSGVDDISWPVPAAPSGGVMDLAG